MIARVATKVVVPVAEPEMLDERKPVVGQHIRRIGGAIVRFDAVPVATEVRRYDPVPLSGESVVPAPWVGGRDPRAEASGPTLPGGP